MLVSIGVAFLPANVARWASGVPIEFSTSIVVVGAREIAGPSLAYIAIGLLGVALLSAVLPPGSLQSTMEHKNP